MLSNESFARAINVELLNQIADAAELDKKVADAFKTLLESKSEPLGGELAEWQVEFYGETLIIFKNGKQYIPLDTNI